MTLKNRTSSKHRKPSVYVDQSNLKKESNTAYLNAIRAKKYASIRRPNAAAASGVKKVEENDEDVAIDDNDNDVATSSDGVDGLASSAPAIGLDGFTVSLVPFRSADSSTLATTTISVLKDDKVLGVALWEWLLNKLDWDCHTLWEKFLCDWDLITETERPPGTNRPINLHSYLTYLKSVNNKRIVRKDIRDVRATLLQERTEYLRDHAEDHLALPNLQALNGTLLQYYLKIKNLIPYESKTQLKKKEQADKKRKAEVEGGGTGASAESDEVIENDEPAKKKAKKAAPTPRPTQTGPLKLGQASCFAALLDCD